MGRTPALPWGEGPPNLPVRPRSEHPRPEQFPLGGSRSARRSPAGCGFVSEKPVIRGPFWGRIALVSGGPLRHHAASNFVPLFPRCFGPKRPFFASLARGSRPIGKDPLGGCGTGLLVSLNRQGSRHLRVGVSQRGCRCAPLGRPARLARGQTSLGHFSSVRPVRRPGSCARLAW